MVDQCSVTFAFVLFTIFDFVGFLFRSIKDFVFTN